MEGLVIFNKPPRKTSTEITNFFKKLTNKKVGHGGTLDPLAQGLLIIGIGEVTKELTRFLKESKKTYLAEIVLGAVSDTYDAEGKIIETRKRVPEFLEIEKVLKSFIGEIEQVPPPYSAIKIKGKRASDLVREGKKVKLKPRKVKIYDIKILEMRIGTNNDNSRNNLQNFATIKIEVEVSSGTYVRSLAHDLGQKLGCGAYLNNLIRTKIKVPQSKYFGLHDNVRNSSREGSQKFAIEYNEYSLEEALTFEDIEKDYLEFLAKIYGRVQGVGFRFFVEALANKLQIFGYAKNLADGTVEVLAQGKEKNLQILLDNLKIGPKLAKVEKIDIVFRKPLKYFYDFRIY